MRYWKASDFTKAELARVNRDEFYDEIYVLLHSPAAREMFARLQMLQGIDELCGERRAIANCIADLSCDVINNDPLSWMRRRTPWRVCGTTGFRIQKLVEALGHEERLDEYGDETLCRTILGWRQY